MQFSTYITPYWGENCSFSFLQYLMSDPALYTAHRTTYINDPWKQKFKQNLSKLVTMPAWGGCESHTHGKCQGDHDPPHLPFHCLLLIPRRWKYPHIKSLYLVSHRLDHHIPLLLFQSKQFWFFLSTSTIPSTNTSHISWLLETAWKAILPTSREGNLWWHF